MDVEPNLTAIKKDIAAAAKKAGRSAAGISLICVSKTQSDEKIAAAIKAGQTVFGENRVQEAQSHFTALKAHNLTLTLHLIGPLQTNKVKQAVALFDCIQTLDRVELAKAIADECKKQQKTIPLMLQVNTGEEAQKNGVLPHNLPQFLKDIAPLNLTLTGLMCIPPVGAPAALHFGLLKKLAQRHNLPHLSMGMSGDFAKAIALGATHIRVGSAIFGERG